MFTLPVKTLVAQNKDISMPKSVFNDTQQSVTMAPILNFTRQRQNSITAAAGRDGKG